jgi:hypothetical protein
MLDVLEPIGWLLLGGAVFAVLVQSSVLLERRVLKRPEKYEEIPLTTAELRAHCDIDCAPGKIDGEGAIEG